MIKQTNKAASLRKAIGNIYVNNKAKIYVLNICIIGDILLDTPEFDFIKDINLQYTEDKEKIADFTDLECFSLAIQATQSFLAMNEEIRSTTFLQDCVLSTEEVLKFLTYQQKMDTSVLLNYLNHLFLNVWDKTEYSRRGRLYIESLKKSDHTYKLIGKNINGLNRTIDRALKDIVDLELKKHKLTL